MNLDKRISQWLSDYLNDNKLDSFIVGVSGGIDSALTSTLCAQTEKKTILVLMPILQNPDETSRGIKHFKWLKEKYDNCEIVEIDLTNAFNSLVDTIPQKFHNKLSLANTRARLRMSALYAISGGCRGLVVGTGNKIEDFGVGFFTKYGDGGVDISPIADLMKSEVYDLAKKLGINSEILNARPTDGLWDDGRTDEDQLGISYDELEWAMNYVDGDITDKEERILKIYKKHRDDNFHKMKSIPIFKK